jgi:hypothetical protein
MITRDGLIAEYLFNSNADDTSGNGFHGVVQGATPTADRSGKPNSAYAFDGVTPSGTRETQAFVQGIDRCCRGTA